MGRRTSKGSLPPLSPVDVGKSQVAVMSPRDSLSAKGPATMTPLFCEPKALLPSRRWPPENAPSLEETSPEAASTRSSANGAPGIVSEGGSTTSLSGLTLRPHFEGGRTFEDARTRLRSSSDVLSPNELSLLRTVFRRFQPAGTSEVAREDLAQMLLQLGYFAVSEEEVETIAVEVSRYSTFSFQEFGEVAERVVAREQRAILDAFAAVAVASPTGSAEAGHRLRATRFPDALRRLGATAPLFVAAECAATLGLGPDAALDFDAFVDCLAVWSMNEGFGERECLAIVDVFRASAIAGQEMPPRRLPEALLRAVGAHELGAAQAAVARLAGAGRDAAWGEDENITLYEFMACARRVREGLLRAMWQRFDSADNDRDGLVTIDELIFLLPDVCGITLVRGSAHEFLEDVLEGGVGSPRSIEADDRQPRLDFDGFVHFMNACKASDGFAKTEIEELEAVFKRFDYDGSNAIETLELLDMLRFLGYTTSLEIVHRLVKTIDVDSSGGLDFAEFRRLMRMHRELEIQACREVFDAKSMPNWSSCASSFSDTTGFCGDGSGVAATCLPELLANFGWDVEACSAELVIREFGPKERFSFDDFFAVAQRYRKVFAAERRKRAGFFSEEVTQVELLLKECGVSEGERVTWTTLEKLLVELGVHMCTADHRRRVFDALKDARQAALESGVDARDVEARPDESISLPLLLHLLRTLSRRNEIDILAREITAMEETKYSHADVAGFREIFLNMIEFGSPSPEGVADAKAAAPPRSSSPVNRRRRPQSARSSVGSSITMTSPSGAGGFGVDGSVARLLFQHSMRQRGGGLDVLRVSLGGACKGARLSLLEMLELLRTLGLRPSQEHRQQLADKVAELGEHRHSALSPVGERTVGDASALSPTGDQATATASASAAPPPTEIDFAAFLFLMRWMSDVNFAKLNEAVSRILADRQVMSVMGPGAEDMMVGVNSGSNGKGFALAAAAAAARGSPGGSRVSVVARAASQPGRRRSMG